MNSNGAQGQSRATHFKQSSLRSILASILPLYQKSGSPYPFYYIDTNCGCGYNHSPYADCEGSPVIFAAAVKQARIDNFRAVLCDSEQVFINHLLKLEPFVSDDRYVTYAEDNKQMLRRELSMLRMAPETVRQYQGLIFIDPNGWFYDAKRHSAISVALVKDLCYLCPLLDVALHLNIALPKKILGAEAKQTSWRRSAALLNPLGIREYLGRKFGSIRIPKNGSNRSFTMLVLSNAPIAKIHEFHSMDSTDGRKIVAEIRWVDSLRKEF